MCVCCVYAMVKTSQYNNKNETRELGVIGLGFCTCVCKNGRSRSQPNKSVRRAAERTRAGSCVGWLLAKDLFCIVCRVWYTMMLRWMVRMTTITKTQPTTSTSTTNKQLQRIHIQTYTQQRANKKKWKKKVNMPKRCWWLMIFMAFPGKIRQEFSTTINTPYIMYTYVKYII